MFRVTGRFLAHPLKRHDVSVGHGCHAGNPPSTRRATTGSRLNHMANPKRSRWENMGNTTAGNGQEFGIRHKRDDRRPLRIRWQIQGGSWRIIPVSNWLITMVIVSPQDLGLFPFHSWHFLVFFVPGGVIRDPITTYDTWESILRVGFSDLKAGKFIFLAGPTRRE